MYRACLASLVLAGCAAPPEQDQGLLDITITKTREQIRAENQQDIEAARKAGEWQAYVCAQSEPERTRLLEESAEKHGWRIICS